MDRKEKKDTVKRLWNSDLGNGRYRNPVLHGDYSDPDVIRVGETYYMTASSFNFMPGLPILTSHDLVNWKLENYAVKRLPYVIYDKPAHARGIWAPSLRYHNNKFWIFFGMPDEGIFMTCTADPLKEWEPLVCIQKGKGLIDTCPFWEEDGKAYIIHAYANSRIGIKSKLAIFEMNPEGTCCISEDRIIFDGTRTQPTIEGPKVYKHDDMYYILAPAGGVKNGWQTALRSSSIYGPYEEKIVMHQGDTNINGPHQGGLVDTLKGEEWFLHFQQKGAYGRIVHLQPVKWTDGWPVIGIDINKDGIGEPVYEHAKPEGTARAEIYESQASDSFDTDQLKLQWQWPANYSDHYYSLKEQKGRLCLYPVNTTGEDKAVLWNSANLLTQKIICPEFTAETKMDFSELSIGARSGILIIGSQYAALYVKRQEEGYRIAYLESEGEQDTRKEDLIMEAPIGTGNALFLRVSFNRGGVCEFFYSTDSLKWSTFNRKFLVDGAVWVGAKVGIFAVSDQNIVPAGKVFFDYFKVSAGLE